MVEELIILESNKYEAISNRERKEIFETCPIWENLTFLLSPNTFKKKHTHTLKEIQEAVNLHVYNTVKNIAQFLECEKVYFIIIVQK